MSYYLKKNDYKDDDGSEIANKYRVLESAAKMIADNPKALGLSEDEWANYLFQYFELVEKTHGKDALDQLKHITTPARHVKEDYYNAKGNGSGSETDRGVLGGVQGGGEGSPKGTSTEKESDGGASSADRRVNGGLQEEKGIDEINRRMRSGLGREAPNGTAEEGRSGNTKDILRGGEISKGDSEHKTDGDIRGVVSSAPGDDAKREGDSRGGAGITRAAEEGDSESGSLEDRIAPSETGTKYKFGSTQANLPEGSPAHGAILAMQEKIPDSDLAGDGKDVDQPHVTVRYGLKTDLTPELRKFIESQSPFEAKLGPTTAFPPSKSSDGAAPIVAPVISPELHRINAEIEKQGEFEPSSFPEYRPHVSVAYVKPELAKKYTGMKDAEGKTFPITSIAVTDKNGDHTEIPLKGESPSAAGQESSLESNTDSIGGAGIPEPVGGSTGTTPTTVEVPGLGKVRFDENNTMYFAYLGDTNIATASLSDDGSYLVSVHVEAPYRRKGVSTALYDFIERHIGHPLKPSPRYQSEDAKKFWGNRGGAAVIPIKGNTVLAAAPIQIPPVPVVRAVARVLPRQEIMAMAEGMNPNPQRQVSSVRELMKLAKSRMIP
jgi:2'-5' RNA ligase